MTPNVISHNILAGAAISGVAPDGALLPTTPATPTFGGVVQSYDGCTDGGLFEFSKMAPRNGVSILGVLFSGAGTIGFSLDVISTSLPFSGGGVPEHSLLTSQEQEFTSRCASIESFAFHFERPVIIPAGFDLRFASAGNLTSEARLTLIIGPGLGAPTGFVQVQSN